MPWLYLLLFASVTFSFCFAFELVRNCTSSTACQNLHFFDNSIQLNCDGEHSCYNITLSDITQGEITCSGEQSCSNFDVTSLQGEFNIRCTNYRSCMYINVNLDGNDASINFDCQTWNSCENNSLYCSNNTGNCIGAGISDQNLPFFKNFNNILNCDTSIENCVCQYPWNCKYKKKMQSKKVHFRKLLAIPSNSQKFLDLDGFYRYFYI